jgi:hypothetical protein
MTDCLALSHRHEFESIFLFRKLTFRPTWDAKDSRRADNTVTVTASRTRTLDPPASRDHNRWKSPQSAHSLRQEAAHTQARRTENGSPTNFLHTLHEHPFIQGLRQGLRKMPRTESSAIQIPVQVVPAGHSILRLCPRCRCMEDCFGYPF